MATHSIGAVPRAATQSQVTTRARLRSLRNFAIALLFLSPSLVVFVFFVFIPLLKTIQLSAFLTNPIGRRP